MLIHLFKYMQTYLASLSIDTREVDLRNERHLWGLIRIAISTMYPQTVYPVLVRALPQTRQLLHPFFFGGNMHREGGKEAPT